MAGGGPARVLDLLGELVAIDTTNPPGNERAAAEYLANLLEPAGFSVELQEVGPGRANLVATLVGGQPGPCLALNGHLDVVAADPAAWRHDPFVMQREGGRVTGRGVCDMKGGVAAMVVAALEAAPRRKAFAGSLQLVLVADEELGTLGTLKYLEGKNRPEAVVIGEPTGMDVCVAHRGVARCRVTLPGKSGHAGRPADAENPLYTAARFLLKVEEHNARLAKGEHPLLPPASIAATIVAGGEQSNSIPGACSVTLDRRTLPGETRDVLQRELDGLLAAVGAQAAQTEFFVDVPASQPLPGASLSARCLGVLHGQGIGAREKDFGACCDMFAFNRAGIDCVLVGPGNLEQAHTANEWCEVAQLELARGFYYELILRYLGAE